MEKTIFKKGDRVYHLIVGWCIVKKVNEYSNGSFGIICSVTIESNKKKAFLPIKELSFTEYTLNNFSQERPIDYSEWVGKLCKFWNITMIGYMIRKFERVYSNDRFECSQGLIWDRCELLTEEQVKILELETKEV